MSGTGPLDLSNDPAPAQGATIVATVLTPIMGIVGTVIGFYFGEKSK